MTDDILNGLTLRMLNSKNPFYTLFSIIFIDSHIQVQIYFMQP